ncbi:helix-turn-helix domain-containing protein [Amycolatopsis sp. NPDC048633]|uniref:MarR family transcriptional regulator n=1 Tax=Amycolatopsis sp. NPDC048633 TaxID=3157095 RepID=UPI0033CC5097
MPETQNPPSNDTKPETAEVKVHRTLEANPGTTTANLAKTAGVGRSTASKLLSRWAKEGLVIRSTGDDQSVPVTWTLRDEQNDGAAAEVAATGEDVAPMEDQKGDAPAGDVEEREADPSPSPAVGVSAVSDPAPSGDPTADTPNKERLPKGALYELVREFLQARPGEEFGPAKIGTELARSSGAVNNALEKLVTNGLATKTCAAPKRFTSN